MRPRSDLYSKSETTEAGNEPLQKIKLNIKNDTEHEYILSAGSNSFCLNNYAFTALDAKSLGELINVGNKVLIEKIAWIELPDPPFIEEEFKAIVHEYNYLTGEGDNFIIERKKGYFIDVTEEGAGYSWSQISGLKPR